MKYILKFKFVIVLLILTFFAVGPLLHAGLPPTHDGEYHVIRFYEFDKTLRDGSIYPRWASDLNNTYGVPLFNYVYPLPNYVGALFHSFGISFINSFKISLLAATVIGVLFFYLWLRIFFISLAALTGAVFYAFAPYRFVDIYVRGSVGEVWALAWFPAFLWAITKLIKERKIFYLPLASIFLAATIFSHNILALMCMMFGVLYTAFLVLQAKEKKLLIAYCLLLIFLGLSLSAVFWLPALVETKYVQGLQIYDVKANFPELYQLLIPSWGTGFSGGGLEGQMSFQIGVGNLLAVFVGVFLLLKHFKKKTAEKKLLSYFMVCFILVFFLLQSVSQSLWDTIPLLNYFQFPWRFLSLMILICAFIAGASVSLIRRKKLRIFVSVLFITIAILTTISYTKPAYYHARTDAYYLTRNNFIHGTNSPGDLFNTIWINKMPPLKDKKIDVIKGKAKITIHEEKTTKFLFTVESEKPSKIRAHIAYFPGWKASVDGKSVSIGKTKQGTITFILPEGKHIVKLYFSDTMVRRVAGGISIVALIVCVGLFRFRKRVERFV